MALQLALWRPGISPQKPNPAKKDGNPPSRKDEKSSQRKPNHPVYSTPSSSSNWDNISVGGGRNFFFGSCLFRASWSPGIRWEVEEQKFVWAHLMATEIIMSTTKLLTCCKEWRARQYTYSELVTFLLINKVIIVIKLDQKSKQSSNFPDGTTNTNCASILEDKIAGRLC